MSRKPICVLSIEDHPGDGEWIQDFLTEDEHTSFNIVCTGSIATGLTHLAEHDVDIILLDLSLPDSQDLATIAILRDRAPAVPLVVMANLDDETLAAQIVRAGAQEYLVKGRIGRDGMIRVIRYAIERRRADEALHAVKAYTENLINSSLDMIVTVDTDYRIILFNPAAEQALGYRQVDVVGKSVDIIYPHQTECVYIRRQLETTGVFIGEAMNKRKDGSVFPAYLSASPLRDSCGRIVGFMSISRDISEQKRSEAERERLYQQFVKVSRQAGMAEVATGVLHNVGNVLNSLNAAAALALEGVRESHVTDLAKAVALIDAHRDDLGTFITTDPRGQHLPTFLRHLSQRLLDERATTLGHIQAVTDKAEHIQEIVAMQQSYATAAGTIEPLALATLMDDAIKTNDESFRRHEVEVVRAYAELPLVLTDRHKVLQILINLISNAKHALLAADSAPKRLTVRVGAVDADQVYLEVEDNGVGIAAADMTRIFQHGFTTKAQGHGFGLHSSALAAQELRGRLSVHSDGPGRGAVFRLELPMKEAESCTV